MIGRFLAWCGWLAWQVERRLAATPLRRLGTRRVVAGLALVLVVAGIAPVVAATLQAQPQDATVADVRDGLIVHPDRWVRLRGLVVPLTESPTGEEGNWGLLVDAVERLQAIVLSAEQPIQSQSSTAVTGHLAGATVEVTEKLPIEATVAGTPPRVVNNLIVDLDAAPLAERGVLWPLVIVPWALAAALGLGLRVGYPLFRGTREIDVLARPMAPGERIPAAIAGRLGERSYPFEEPANALILCRQGPFGGILTVQVMSAEGPTPPPLQVGGSSWTSGRIGYLYTVSETLPALVVHAERVDATIMFARSSERDRAAALVSVER